MTVTFLGSANDFSAGGVTTLALTTGADSPAGNTVVLVAAWSSNFSAFTIQGIVDGTANAYAADLAPTQIGTDTTEYGAIAGYRVAGAAHLASGSIITVTWPNIVTNVHLVALSLVAPPPVDGLVALQSGGPSFSIGPVAASPGGGAIVIAAIATILEHQTAINQVLPDVAWTVDYNWTGGTTPGSFSGTVLCVVHQDVAISAGPYTFTGTITEGGGRGDPQYFTGYILGFHVSTAKAPTHHPSLPSLPSIA